MQTKHRSGQEIPDEPDDTWLDALQDDIMQDATSKGPISFEEALTV